MECSYLYTDYTSSWGLCVFLWVNMRFPATCSIILDTKDKVETGLRFLNISESKRLFISNGSKAAILTHSDTFAVLNDWLIILITIGSSPLYGKFLSSHIHIQIILLHMQLILVCAFVNTPRGWDYRHVIIIYYVLVQKFLRTGNYHGNSGKTDTITIQLAVCNLILTTLSFCCIKTF